MKRGLLDVCVLAAIQGEDSYGYQIIKEIRPYVDVSESTLHCNAHTIYLGVGSQIREDFNHSVKCFIRMIWDSGCFPMHLQKSFFDDLGKMCL